ncbi:hypothetical protein AHAS_Ahas19G0232100 [Arachis hypogaea]
MAHTKTTARRPSSSQATKPSSAPSRPSASKKKCPVTEEELRDPPRSKPKFIPQCSQRVNPRISLRPVKKPPNIDPFTFKSHFVNSHSHFNPHRFSSAINFEFYKGVVVHRPLCPTYLADLPALKKKGLNFVKNIVFLDWNHLFKIKKPVYSDLVHELYANMTYHGENVHSYVKVHELNMNSKTISKALGYSDVGVNAYTSRK